MKNFLSALAMAIVLIAIISIGSCVKEVQCPGTCQNGGTCNTSNGVCGCIAGYSGNLCQTAANAQFIGNYIGTLSCSGQSPVSAEIDIRAGSNGPYSIIVDGGYLFNATISGPNFNIPYQSYNDGINWFGSGEVTNSGSLLTLVLTESDQASGTMTCAFSGVK